MSFRSKSLYGSRCAVIGGAGFIGSHIVDAALESEAEHVLIYDNFCRGTIENLSHAMNTGRVTIIKGDIRDSDLLNRSLSGYQFVFHQAAIHLRRCEHNPREAIDINEIGSFNVADACIHNNVHKLIAASSSSVYGEGIDFPTNERHPLLTRLFYGAAKVGAEHYYTAFRHKFGLNFIGLRYLNVYGPRQDSKGAYTEVIMSFLNSIDRHESPIIHGDGNQTLDLVFVKDVVRANLLALDSPIEEGFFNVCTGHETTVLELFNLLCELCEVKLEANMTNDTLNLVTRRYGCPKQAATKLNFIASTGIAEGLRHVIEWRNRRVKEVNRND